MSKKSTAIIIGVIGALVASYFLSTPGYVYGITGLIAAISCFGYILSLQWEQSEPNQWLLVIENGKLIKSGIGLKCFVWPHQTVVKFASTINKVTFTATNVTKEMQGLQVSGFAIWSVNRELDGPFKCYKYIQGGDANGNVKTMCESIVRHQIANHSLQQVLTNRNMLRDSMKTDLQKQLTGWGVWLETVEITEVNICSRNLFEDLQAEYRQETHLKAEQIRQTTYNKVEENRLSSEFNLNKSRIDTETQRIKYQADEELKRQVEEAKIYQKKCDLEMEKLNKEQELQISKLNHDHSVTVERKKHEQEIDKLQREFDLQMFSKSIEIDKQMNSMSLQKYIVDSTERIYKQLPIKEFKLNSYIGPENAANVASFLPAVGMMMQQNQEMLKQMN